LRKQVFDVNQMVVENLLRDIEQPENCGISYGVVNVQSFLTADHDVAGAQDGELLRERALLDLEKATKLIDANLSFAQSIQDCNPQGMRESLEELRLKSP